MKANKICVISLLFSLSALFIQAQTDPWIIKAANINPAEYYGITTANGMIGIVSAPEPFKIKDVVLAGAYDNYGRGRVSNFLRSFNLLNMYLDIDGKRMDARSVTDFAQEPRLRILIMHSGNFRLRF
jgi:protein-glucosylgalactosylhydroxylysine glucosidase